MSFLKKYNWLLPLTFAFACGIFSYLSMFAERDHVRVLNDRTALGTESEKTWEVKLKPGKMYTIDLSSSVKAFEAYNVNIDMMFKDALIFSLEDAYWHELGSWSEGGESGSWEESNVSTLFNFRVKKKGLYTLKMGLSNSEGPLQLVGFEDFLNVKSSPMLGRPKIKAPLKKNFTIQLKESTPLPFGWWPFAIAVVFFLGLTLYIFSKRGMYFVESLYDYDVGTIFEIEGKRFEVTQVADYFYAGDHWSTEFTLRSDSPGYHYLCADKFELEAGESTKTYHQALLSSPLSDDQVRELGSCEQNVLSFEGKRFSWDRDNSDLSGLVKRIIVKNDIPYLSKVYTKVFHETHDFPTKAGQIWLDCSYDEVAEGEEESKEWTLSVVQDWTKIQISNAIKRNGPPFTPRTMVNEKS